MWIFFAAASQKSRMTLIINALWLSEILDGHRRCGLLDPFIFSHFTQKEKKKEAIHETAMLIK